jgi:hypothetical protein
MAFSFNGVFPRGFGTWESISSLGSVLVQTDLYISDDIDNYNKNVELPDQWKESVTVPVHKKGDKTDCSNCHGISLLSPSYKILSNILLRLSLYIDEIIGNHQHGFQCNRSTTDQIFAFVR